MRRLLLVALALLVADVALVAAPAPRRQRAARPRIQVGLVFDVGGRGDKSFNDAAYRGLDQAMRQMPIAGEVIEPGEGADREAGIRMLAARGFDLIIGVGFIFSQDITAIALEYPRTAFACVDYAPAFDRAGRPMPIPPNLVGLKFREEEGSLLVGAIAALVSRTRTVGFVGGMDMPLIHKFEEGYRAGVREVCADCRVLVAYAGSTPAAFKDPERGKTIATSQYAAGADVIYHASGSTGLGVFQAARRLGRLAIGVDSDQQAEAPGHILTSMVKRVDVAVVEVIRAVLERRFEGGLRSFGLAEHGIDYVYDRNNERWITPAIRQRVESIRERIVRATDHSPGSDRSRAE